jgi:uncharacterized protein YycO
MRKNVVKNVLGLVVALGIIFASGSTSFATDSLEISQQQSLDEKTYQEELEKANSQKMYKDKTGNSPMTPKLTRGVGVYPRRYGVILVTADKYKGIIPTGHAAIIWSSQRVVESLANGVTTGPNNWNVTKTTCYAVGPIRTTEAQDNAASNWCYSQKGKPYNFNYLNVDTRSSFYCSQLVWAAFKDNYGIDLNTSAYGRAVHPMELVNSPETGLIYQK